MPNSKKKAEKHTGMILCAHWLLTSVYDLLSVHKASQASLLPLLDQNLGNTIIRSIAIAWLVLLG